MYYVEPKTAMAESFETFLKGGDIAFEMSQLLVNEVAHSESLSYDYNKLLKEVKNNLNAKSVVETEHVLFVYYNKFGLSNAEKSVIIRLLNLRYKDRYMIVLNEAEVIRIPDPYKVNSSINDLNSELIKIITKNKNKLNKIRNIREKKLEFTLVGKTEFINPEKFLTKEKNNLDIEIDPEVLEEAMATYHTEETQGNDRTT